MILVSISGPTKNKSLIGTLNLNIMKLNPCLIFNGNCEEAFNFYKSVFQKEFKYLGRYKDVADTDRLTFKENDEKIMHVALPITDHTTLMGSDHTQPNDAVSTNDAFALYINACNRAEADRLFNELS